jgi:hypothetical protein
MAGLSMLDIRRKTETVNIDDENTVDVVGLSFDTIGQLLERFPILFEALSGRLGAGFPDLVKKAPDAVAAVIAAGSGELNNKKAEKVAKDLPIGVQLELCQAIGRVTFPKGVRPFLEAVNATFGASPVPAFVAPDMRSPKPSSNSKAPDGPMSGASAPVRPAPSSSSAEKSM